MSAASRERTMDLLADRALQGLDQTDHAELDRLLSTHPELDDDSFDLAAAAAALARVAAAEPLPEHLRRRVEADASAYFSPRRDAGSDTTKVVPLPARSGWAGRAGWYAAAASLVLAAVAWWTRPEPPPVAVAPPPPPTAEQLRDRLLVRPDTVRIAWTQTNDPDAKGVEGDVVWNASTQRGYMRFRGLPTNDPANHQYQLWIFDAKQDARYPVDGGVFDVPAGASEVVVPIVAKLKVEQATLFAVTEEKPGGVVVSSRERLVLLAKV